jgi:hypothetical protein
MDADARLSRLRAQAGRVIQTPLKDLVAADPARAQAFALRVGPLYANFARQHYDRDALAALFELAEQSGVRQKLQALFDGEKINLTEGRRVLHTALRGDVSSSPVARAAHAQALEARTRMRALIDALAASDVTDIVSVGIGGSDLGPRLAVDALTGAAPGRFRVHFLSNVDGHAAQRVLAGLDPRRTAAVLISKTFGTQETLLNGAILRDWLGGNERLYAVSANVERAAEAFAIPPERILPMWDWVGGRYSLWSAVGLPIALAIGMDAFEAMLDGASQMDAHVLDTPLPQNLAAWHALTAIWNRNALGYATQAVLAYDERLKLLSNYLQQPGGPPRRFGSRGRHGAGVVGRCRHRHPAQLLPGAASGHVDRSRRLHRRGPLRCAVPGQPSRAAGQPAGADRSLRQRPGQRRPAPRVRRWPPEHDDPARCVDAAGVWRAARAVRAQRVPAVGDLGHQRLRPVRRGTGQAGRQPPAPGTGRGCAGG